MIHGIENREQIKSFINDKKQQDKKKFKNLALVALFSAIIRILFYFLPMIGLLPFSRGSRWIELLWIPPVLFVLALPFYGFEKLLDKLKK